MTSDLIRLTPVDRVLLLCLARPEKRNALATPLFKNIAGALTGADGDIDVGTVVITGSDKVFVAGADLD